MTAAPTHRPFAAPLHPTDPVPRGPGCRCPDLSSTLSRKARLWLVQMGPLQHQEGYTPRHVASLPAPSGNLPPGQGSPGAQTRSGDAVAARALGHTAVLPHLPAADPAVLSLVPGPGGCQAEGCRRRRPGRPSRRPPAWAVPRTPGPVLNPVPTYAAPAASFAVCPSVRHQNQNAASSSLW